MQSKQGGWTLYEGGLVVWLVVILVGLVGWVLNIVAIVGMLGGPITAMFVARCVGVFAAPLGAILGFF